MTAVTQRVDNYLGGVSRQSDDKKLTGQVTECLNGYPDPTFGLVKRPGFKWISNLGTGTMYDTAKWFYQHRDADEKYIGCIQSAESPKPGQIHIWNAGTGEKCTVNDDTIVITLGSDTGNNGTSGATTKTNLATTTSGSGTGMTVNVEAVSGVITAIKVCAAGSGYSASDTITIASSVAGTGTNVVGSITSLPSSHYLVGTRNNFDVLTVQDTSILTNNLIVTAKKADPTFISKAQATLILRDTAISSTYSVTMNNGTGGSDLTFTTTSSATETYDSLLTTLKNGILAFDDASHGDDRITGLQCSTYAASLHVARVVSGTKTKFNITCKGGSANNKLTVFQDHVDNVAGLPVFSFHDHLVKIMNTESTFDTYFASFVADTTEYNSDGTVSSEGAGRGFWEEARDPSVSTGLDETTMPHRLVNDAVNVFSLSTIPWTARLVGDDITNSHPSFVGNKIQQTFFHNNRLGFLSKDNVILSQSSDFYNFYHTSAQAVTDADPIDISCSSIRPAALHGILPTTQGLVLFSNTQQFLMAAADKILTPSAASISTISNYEMDTNVDPVDMGATINFISKTPSYTRVFGMVTRGQDENPQVLDIARVVNEWIPETVDTFIASPQNQFLALSSQTSDTMYVYRIYNDGRENQVEAWVNWKLPGTIQTVVVDSDEMYLVSKQGTQVTLSRASINQSPEDAIIVNNEGQKVNPCVDLYTPADKVSYLPIDTFTITSAGSGYSSAPTVTIGQQWAASTAYTNGDSVFNGDNHYQAVNGGGTSGSTAPTHTSGSVTDGTILWTYRGKRATATATITSNAVTKITLTNAGDGYTYTPTVTLTGNATATASILNGTKCYLPYNDVTDRTPVVVVAGSTATGQYTESGFTITPDKGTDGVGDYVKIDSKDFSSVASNVIVGYKYDLDVTLPRTYFRNDQGMTQSDFSASLTIARMKFAVGLGGVMGFKLKTKGSLPNVVNYTQDESTTDWNWADTALPYIDRSQIKLTINEIASTAFTFVNDTTIRLNSIPTETQTVSADQTDFTWDFDRTDHSKIRVLLETGVGTNTYTLQTLETDYRLSGKTVVFIDTNKSPSAPQTGRKVQIYSADDIMIYTDEWYKLSPTQMAGDYLANDIALDDSAVYTIPIHQKSDNFTLRVFNDSPFPVSLNSMMWEGNYSPRFYRRQ